MYEYILYFIIGSIFGSFINAYSLRVSNKVPKIFNYIEKNNFNYFKSLINEFRLFKYSNKPKRSHCPKCSFKLKWYHNIPLFSYVFLLGKCSNCKVRIPYIYFISEISLGLIFSLFYYIVFEINGFDKDIIGMSIFISYLIIISIVYSSLIIDLKTTLIPDYTYLFIFIPIIYISLVMNFNLYNDFIINKELILGFFVFPIVFYFSMYILALITLNTIGKIYYGMGDIKFISFIMVIYGVTDGVIIYFISAYISILPILYIKYILKKEIVEIPYLIYLFISFILYFIYIPYIHNYLGIN